MGGAVGVPGREGLLMACAGARLTWAVAAHRLTGWREPGPPLGQAAKLQQALHTPQPTGDQELSLG